MKLFTRKNEVPEPRKPDYDFIQKAEKEFRLDDNGFDERMDEAILENFWKTFPVDEDETVEEVEILIQLLYDVARELHSTKYQDQIIHRAEYFERLSTRLRRRGWDQRHTDLRDKMVERGKRRHD